MRRRTTLFVASVLAGLFTIFNVGLPIVYYVCPMMKDGASACDCLTQKNNGSAFKYQRNECCNPHVLAERNTTPFLAVDKYKSPASATAAISSDVVTVSIDFSQSLHSSIEFPETGPPFQGRPSYLLSSSLLI